MRNERWFVSFKEFKRDFLFDMLGEDAYGSVVTDTNPARWVMCHSIKFGTETHILYAEQISLALASELLHSGVCIKADYYSEDE